MKKIFSILISLLLLASAFGVGTAMAVEPPEECDCEEDYYQVSKTSVQVGETFTGSIMVYCVGGLNPDLFDQTLVDMIDLQNVEIDGVNWYVATFKALRPGTLVIKHDVPCLGCGDSVTITITPRALPMQQIMMILGLGGLMRE